MTDLAADSALDWSELAFGSKKPLRELHATFIAAPREISTDRFKQLVKRYLPKGNIVLGLAKEAYIDGFEGQPHFRTLQVATVQTVIDAVNRKSPTHKIYTLAYFQRDAQYVIEKSSFARAVFVNGSWRHMFHVSSVYYALINNHIPYELVSPFADETEAREYERRLNPEVAKTFWPHNPKGLQTENDMIRLADGMSRFSYDYSFQTGVSLGKKKGQKYDFVAATFNKVVPFQTYAMHNGATRETNFSPPNDLNHYDTVHAEVELLVLATKRGIDLKGTTLFINLLPCPSCARMFAETDIETFVYVADHSDGYALKLLEKAGKKVKRVVV